MTMTLFQLVKTLEDVAADQPTIRTIVRNDVFRINSAPSLKYGVFAWLQGQHSGNVSSSLMSYQFTLFYVDRLTEDGGNQVEIQSTGCQTLTNIIRSLEDKGVYADSFTLQPFNQRFTDQCAGVFANVTFQIPATSMCSEDNVDNNSIMIF
jgi:hypothetical protein